MSEIFSMGRKTTNNQSITLTNNSYIESQHTQRTSRTYSTRLQGSTFYQNTCYVVVILRVKVLLCHVIPFEDIHVDMSNLLPVIMVHLVKRGAYQLVCTCIRKMAVIPIYTQDQIIGFL